MSEMPSGADLRTSKSSLAMERLNKCLLIIREE
jgi:hypothetical protein